MSNSNYLDHEPVSDHYSFDEKGHLRYDDSAYHWVPIGTRNHPFPKHYIEDTPSGMQTVLGVMQAKQNAYGIYSLLDWEHVYYTLLRDMPTESMLEAFWQGMLDRLPDSEVIGHLYLGETGVGKTYLATLFGRVTDPRGAIVFDCGGRNVGDLLYKVVLDTSKDQDLYELIMDRLNGQDGRRAKNTSIRLPKDALGHLYQELPDGRIFIDWDRVGEEQPDETLAEKYPGTEIAAAYNPDLTAQAIEAMRKFCELEGLRTNSQSAFGFRSEEGDFFKAWREGRSIVFDEYTKMKATTDTQLHRFHQFVQGEIDEYTAASPDNRQSFTFRRGEKPVGTFITLTGNDKHDGGGTIQLSDSAFTRMSVFNFDRMTHDDMVHRITQSITGLPLNMFYRMNEQALQQGAMSRDDFVMLLLHIRTHALSNREVGKQREDGSMQLHQEMTLIWENVLEGADKLATCFQKIEKHLNPESREFREASKATQGALQREVDEAVRAKAAVSIRHIMRMLKRGKFDMSTADSLDHFQGMNLAMLQSPPPEDLTEPTKVSDHPALGYGRRVRDMVKYMIDNIAPPKAKPVLNQVLVGVCEDAGIFHPPLAEARRNPGYVTIAELWDYDALNAQVAPSEAVAVRDYICRYLRERFPDMNWNAKNDAILSEEDVRSAMQTLLDEELVEGEMGRFGAVVNSHIVLPSLDRETLFVQKGKGQQARQPFERVIANDALTAAEEETVFLGVENLASAERLLFSLTMPAGGEYSIPGANLGHIWQPGRDAPPERMIGLSKEAADMALGRSATGLAVSSLLCRSGDAPAYLHLIHDKAHNYTLVVGYEDIDTRLFSRLRAQNIAYINATSLDDLEQIDELVDAMLTKPKDDVLKKMGKPQAEMFEKRVDATKAHLVQAFLARNGMPDAYNKASLLPDTLSMLLMEMVPQDCLFPNSVTTARTSQEFTDLVQRASQGGNHAR